MLDIAGDLWTDSSDVILWTPTRRHTSVILPAKSYIPQIYVNTSWRVEDSRAMTNRDTWRERVKGIPVRFNVDVDDDDPQYS